MTANTDYNGWKNRQTWNVSLWLNNDEWLYNHAVKWMKNHKNSRSPYAQFIRSMGMQNEKTGDGYKWLSTRLDYKALNGMMKELIEG